MLFLSQENIELAKTEAESLLELEALTLKENLLITQMSDKFVKAKKYVRLAYTKKVLELLFICNPRDLDNALYQYDFSKVYKNNFCLRIHDEKHAYNEVDYAKYIWRGLESRKVKPRVDLENPSTLIEIIILDNKAFVCRKLFNNTEDFEARKAHQKPELHPTAMHPKMARALVNILNRDSMIDPFCGAGGILCEAGLMKLKFKGYDIDEVQINRAKINMKHLKINPRSYKLEKKDATKIKNLKNIVTDLPYGKSSKKSSEIIKLYSAFIKNISGRSVIVFPDFVNYKKILKENLNKKLEIKKIISHYVHKSLTRKIVVIN